MDSYDLDFADSDSENNNSTGSFYAPSEADHDFDDLKLTDHTLDHFRDTDRIEDGLEIPFDLTRRVDGRYLETPPLTAIHTPDISFKDDKSVTFQNFREYGKSGPLLITPELFSSSPRSPRPLSSLPGSLRSSKEFQPSILFHKVVKPNHEPLLDDLDCLDDISDMDETPSLPLTKETKAESPCKLPKTTSRESLDNLDEISDLEDESTSTSQKHADVQAILAKYAEPSDDESEFQDVLIKPTLAKPPNAEKPPLDINSMKPPSMPGMKRQGSKNALNRLLLKNIQSRVDSNFKKLPQLKRPSSSSSDGDRLNRKNSISTKVAFGRCVSTAKPTTQPTPKSASFRLTQSAKPTLIRNPGGHSKPKVVGQMTYDPKLKTWHGNNKDLDIFESHLSRTRPKPNLIPHSSSLETQIGEMIFDPINLVWKGNENQAESHIFDEIDQLQDLTQCSFRKGVDKPMMDTWFKQEVEHKLLMGNWYPLANQSKVKRDASRLYMYDMSFFQ